MGKLLTRRQRLKYRRIMSLREFEIVISKQVEATASKRVSLNDVRGARKMKANRLYRHESQLQTSETTVSESGWYGEFPELHA
jgi:hypothetical protein